MEHPSQSCFARAHCEVGCGQGQLLHTSTTPVPPTISRVQLFAGFQAKNLSSAPSPCFLPINQLALQSCQVQENRANPSCPSEASQPLVLLRNKQSLEQGKQQTLVTRTLYIANSLTPQKGGEHQAQARLQTLTCNIAIPHLPSPRSGERPGKGFASVSALFFFPLGC